MGTSLICGRADVLRLSHTRWMVYWSGTDVTPLVKIPSVIKMTETPECQ